MHFPMYFRFALKLCSPAHGKHYLVLLILAKEDVCIDFIYCFVFIPPEVIHAKSFGISHVYFA